MALFNITIEKVIVKNDNDEIIKLLKEIKCLVSDGGATELEEQMDSWLLQMKTSFDKLDEINKQVS